MKTADHELAIRSLATMAHALGRSEDLSRLLEIAAEEARDALHSASVSISRVEPGTVTVRTIINAGELGPNEVRWPDNEVYAVRDGVNLGRVLDDLITWTADVEDPDCDSYEMELLQGLGKGSALGAPIVVDGKLWGEFYATRHIGQAAFLEGDAAYVEVLSAILGGAISRSLREESLEHLAFHDPLTGLMNRRALDKQAALAFDVPAGSTRTVTAVAVDINGLKQVNDSLGHTVGDQFIQSVARALHTAFAQLPGSLVARVGGDEFSVLVSGPDTSQVILTANELCQRSWRFVTGAAISAGSATVVLTERSAVTPTELFAAADRAQYVAKRGRLARTVVSDEFEPSLRKLRAASAG